MANVTKIDAQEYSFQFYEEKDLNLMSPFDVNTTLSSSSCIEFIVYDLNKNCLSINYDYQDYTLTSEGMSSNSNGEDISQFNINASNDLENSGFEEGEYVAYYNFLNKRIGSNIANLFIKEISSDRTEIRLDSNTLTSEDIVEQTNKFIQFREEEDYFCDFFLNFGKNKLVICNNIKLENETTSSPTILVKLYEPLPNEFDLKSLLWVVTQINPPQAFQASFPITQILQSNTENILGPNFNIPLKSQINNSTGKLSENNILSGAPTSSLDQLESLLNEKSINISIDYEKFTDFIHFSSAKTRLENFYYKVSLLEQYSSSIASLSQVTGSNSSKLLFEKKTSEIIKSFDGYDKFLYYNSGSSKTWPKTTSEPPYLLAKTGSAEVVNWYGSDDEISLYYGGMILSSSNFDNQNPDQLLKSIPEYLREDPQNKPYELFIDMVAQYYDSIWLYTKDITQKYNADNRLDFGISKDLVADAVKDFGVKLYQNNFSNDDLYTAFLGLTPSGSIFPFPNITGSTPAPSGFELITSQITASSDIISMDDTNKSLYKRLYHNIPYLLKSKGTIPGLRALITSYGIPDTILRISEFGGKDQVNENDWDYYFHKFNYAWDTQGDNSLRTPWELNPQFSPSPYTSSLGNPMPGTIEFRFKTPGIPDTKMSQSLWFTTSSAGIDKAVVLEYNGSGSLSGSYSGSIPDPYNQYGTLKYISEPGTSLETSCSIYLPFFDGDWWSVMVRNNGFDAFDPEYIITEPVDYDFIMNEDLGKYVIRERSNTGSIDETGSIALYAANKIYNGDDGTQIGFTRSASITTSSAGTSWFNGATSSFGKEFSSTSEYGYFTGSMQEIRYYNIALGTTRFYDYTMNPLSIEGNGVNASPNQLAFRASLGSEGDLGPQENEIVIQNNNVTFLTTQNGFIYALQPGGAGGNLGGTSIHPKITGSWDKIDSFVSNSIYEFEKDVLVKENREYFFLDQPAVGIKNRITDKIRKENSSIPSGNVLSPIRSLAQNPEISSSYTDNINYLEVAFSPQNEINDDIINQIGYFNIGEYIGDPRQRFTGNRYKDLHYFNEEYFKKYIKNYNLTDFIRLIKFFDNSLFKMIRDFIPVRTSLASGLVIKQHLLERNKYSQPSISYEDKIYTGSIDMYDISGSSGGAFNRFNGLTTSPYGTTGSGPDNRFFITQSWTSSHSTLSGSVNKIQDSQKEFYDGIFSGSNIDVTDGELAGKDCFPQTNLMEVYGIRVYDSSSDFSTSKFLSYNNEPTDGYISLFNEPIQTSSYLDVPPIETSSFVEVPNTPFTLKLVKFEAGEYSPVFENIPLFDDYSKYRVGTLDQNNNISFQGGYGPAGVISTNPPTSFGTVPSSGTPDANSYQIPRDNNLFPFSLGLTAHWTVNEASRNGDIVSFKNDPNTDQNNFYSLAVFNQLGEQIKDLKVNSIRTQPIVWAQGNLNQQRWTFKGPNPPSTDILTSSIDINPFTDADLIKLGIENEDEINPFQGWAWGARNNNEAYRIEIEVESLSSRETSTTQFGNTTKFIFSPSAAWQNSEISLNNGDGVVDVVRTVTSIGNIRPTHNGGEGTPVNVVNSVGSFSGEMKNVKDDLLNKLNRKRNFLTCKHAYFNFGRPGSGNSSADYSSTGDTFNENYNLISNPDGFSHAFDNAMDGTSTCPLVPGYGVNPYRGNGPGSLKYQQNAFAFGEDQINDIYLLNYRSGGQFNMTVTQDGLSDINGVASVRDLLPQGFGNSGPSQPTPADGFGGSLFEGTSYRLSEVYPNTGGPFSTFEGQAGIYRTEMHARYDAVINDGNPLFTNGFREESTSDIGLRGVYVNDSDAFSNSLNYMNGPQLNPMTSWDSEVIDTNLGETTTHDGEPMTWVHPYVIRLDSDGLLTNWTATQACIREPKIDYAGSPKKNRIWWLPGSNKIKCAGGGFYGGAYGFSGVNLDGLPSTGRSTGFFGGSNSGFEDVPLGMCKTHVSTARYEYDPVNEFTKVYANKANPYTHSDFWKIMIGKNTGKLVVRYDHMGVNTSNPSGNSTVSGWGNAFKWSQTSTDNIRYTQGWTQHARGQYYLIFGILDGMDISNQLFTGSQVRKFPDSKFNLSTDNNYGPFRKNVNGNQTSPTGCFGLSGLSWYAIAISVQ